VTRRTTVNLDAIEHGVRRTAFLVCMDVWGTAALVRAALDPAYAAELHEVVQRVLRRKGAP